MDLPLEKVGKIASASPTKSIELSERLSLLFQQPRQLRSDYTFAAHFTALLSVNYKFQPKTVAFILKSDH